MKNILACNWTCLRLFRASQILYRPLQRPCQQRTIKYLAITFNVDYSDTPFASAQFHFRLLENEDVYVRNYTFNYRRLDFQSTERYAFVTDNARNSQLLGQLLGIHNRKYTFNYRRNRDYRDFQSTECYAFVTDNCLLRIQRSYTDDCWPGEPHLVQSLPTVGLPSDIDTIEHIYLDLASIKHRERIKNRYYIEPVPCIQELVSKVPGSEAPFILSSFFLLNWDKSYEKKMYEKS